MNRTAGGQGPNTRATIRMKNAGTSLRLLAALAVVAAAVPLVPLPPAVEASEPAMRVTGRLPVLFEPGMHSDHEEQTGWLILDSTRRRAYQVFELAANTSVRRTVVQSFDLDTLRPLGRRYFPGFLPLHGNGANSFGAGDVMHAVDEETGRVFLALSDGDTKLGIDQDSQRVLHHVEVIDPAAFDGPADTFSHPLAYPSPEHQVLLTGRRLRGMTAYRQDGTTRLLLLWADADRAAGELPHNHQLVQWGVDRPVEDSWTAPTLLASTCRAPLTGAVQNDRTMYQLAVVRLPRLIVLGCQRAPGTALAVRIQLDEQGVPTGGVSSLALPRNYGDTVGDPKTGRLFFRISLNGTTWWAYDPQTHTWAGALGAAASDDGRSVAAGVDAGTGRFYSLVPDHLSFTAGPDVFVPGGLMHADGRLDPVPQLANDRPDLAYPGMFRIAVDPAAAGRPRRLFLRRGSFGGSQCYVKGTTTVVVCGVPRTEEFYVVIEDHAPLAQNAPAVDVDRYTANVEERTGTTAANFDRAGNGFGARVLLVGGLSAAATRTFDSPPFMHGSGCMASDRELVFGHVIGAQASNVTSSAQASRTTYDPATALDLQDPARRCWPTPKVGQGVDPLAAAGPWPAAPEALPGGTGPPDAPAECNGDRDTVEQAEAAPTPGRRGHAEVACAQSAGSARAKASSFLGTEELKVASASSTVSMVDDPERGRVTEVVSEARGVVIGSTISLGLVQSVARTWARGRRGTAGGTYQRTICNVRVEQVVIERCLKEGKEQQDFVATLNQAFASRGEARLRAPDPVYLAGSPGGFQAAVQRTADDQFNDRQFSRDPSKAVPALELIWYRDDPNAGAGRQILQLAAVESSSQYGIYCLRGFDAKRSACNAESADFLGGPSSSDATSSSLLASPMLDDRDDMSLATSSASAERPQRSLLGRLGRRLAALPNDVLRLVLSRPREAGLLAALWALVWLPCYLGERRRSAAVVVAARLQGVR